ncbi:hypothetical protein WJX75_006002 [Coccomyxa subellipsoidea]|uniref:START domain-containing protein n=1 Tax=Coccomyxa subellipsoidea TaxID=248742 RepID=A0ABR2YRW3_9CHLO
MGADMGHSVVAGSWLEGANPLVSTAVGALAFWVLGAVVGLCLPRPKWMATGSPFATSTFYSPAGLLVRRLSLCFQGFYIVREIWNHFTSPGTFHALMLAVQGLLAGNGWQYVPPQGRAHKVRKLRHKKSNDGQQKLGSSNALSWYVGEEDMDFLKERLGQPAGSGPWEHMMAKDFGTFTYEAWRRTLADGKTEYKSVTVAEDSTAEEFMDFYLDDHTRTKWDTMISEHESLEVGDGRQRCQVVRWVRTFPFSFLSKREYIIGRRMWRGPDGCLFGITKSIDHPRAPPARGIVRMDVFWSMWRSRTIPCPHGSGRPACETVLIHHEQFKIPENLARFAVRHGMSGFVKKMGPAVCEFVADRRKRVAPFEDDPEAYGASGTPNPPSRSASVASTEFLLDSASETASETSTAPSTPSGGQPHERRRRWSGEQERKGPLRRLQQVNAALIAAGVAFALGRSTSRGRLL